MPSPLTKTSSLIYINSTGNTFIVDTQPFVNKIIANQEKKWTPTEIKNICAQYKVDGFAILYSHPHHDLQWQFFNADAGGAKMCGNLARGLIYYLSSRSSKKGFSILGPNDIIQKGHIDKQLAFLSMPEAKNIQLPAPVMLNEIYSDNFLTAHKYTNQINYIQLGVPHALIPIYINELSLPKEFYNFFSQDTIKETPVSYALKNLNAPLQNFIKKIRTHTKEGFNVSLFNPNNLRSISFERGVENFTLSCGTGACSIAYYLKGNTEKYKKAKKIIISMPGGQLIINVEKKDYLLGGKCQILNANSI